MEIIFQKEEFRAEKYTEEFSKSNSNAGAIISFIGKVRPKFNQKEIKSLDIEFYERMAFFEKKISCFRLFNYSQIWEFITR